MEINGFTPKESKLVLTDAQVALVAFIGAEITHQLREEIKALETENKRLNARVERLYSFLGLRT